MPFLELTMPLNHEYMADEILPTATPFVLAPPGHPDKGISLGTETGTCLTLPSQFTEFRKTTRLHEVALEKLTLREAVVVSVPRKREMRSPLTISTGPWLRWIFAPVTRPSLGQGGVTKIGISALALHTCWARRTFPLKGQPTWQGECRTRRATCC